MKVPLTRGMFALCDAADWPLLSQYKWRAIKRGRLHYAARNVVTDGRWNLVSMQETLLGLRPGLTIDHINGNGLDNRRRNLRWATPEQNSANGRWPNRCGYKGVSKNGRNGWMAVIRPGRQKVYLGTFRSPEEAAEAYRAAAREIWGEFACFEVRPPKEKD